VKQFAIVHSSIDYLTVKGTIDGPGNAVERAARDAAVNGGGLLDSAYKSNVGPYVGWRVGGVFCGQAGDYVLAQWSGDDAESAMKRLVTQPVVPTRIDLQTTVKHAERYPDSAQDIYNDIKKWRADGTYRWSSRLISSETGDTLYIGSRESEVMLRYYDKSEAYEAELGTYWRYEVEFKRAAAVAVWATLSAWPNWAVRISDLVFDKFSDRDIMPVYARGDTWSEMEIVRQFSTEETRIDWLARQVRPSISKLVEGGFQKQVEEALGFKLKRSDSTEEE